MKFLPSPPSSKSHHVNPHPKKLWNGEKKVFQTEMIFFKVLILGLAEKNNINGVAVAYMVM